MKSTIARWIRAVAQWLDPLPLEVSDLHAHIYALRLATDETRAEMAAHAFAHDADMRALRQTLTSERLMASDLSNEFVAFQRTHENCVPVPRDEAFVMAVALTDEWTERQVSGEFKRHQVLASLIDAFPNREHKDLALAIEAALWE